MKNSGRSRFRGAFMSDFREVLRSNEGTYTLPKYLEPCRQGVEIAFKVPTFKPEGLGISLHYQPVPERLVRPLPLSELEAQQAELDRLRSLFENIPDHETVESLEAKSARATQDVEDWEAAHPGFIEAREKGKRPVLRLRAYEKDLATYQGLRRRVSEREAPLNALTEALRDPAASELLASGSTPSQLLKILKFRAAELLTEQRHIRLYAAASDPDIGSALSKIDFQFGRAAEDAADLLMKVEASGQRDAPAFSAAIEQGLAQKRFRAAQHAGPAQPSLTDLRIDSGTAGRGHPGMTL